MAHHEAGRLVGSHQNMGRCVAHVQVEQLGPAVRVVQRGPLAPRVGQPHRQVVRSQRQQLRRRRVAHQSPDPVDEQAPSVAGPAHGHDAGPSRRERPQPFNFDPLVGEHPRQQGGPAHHQHVARVAAGRHELLAQCVDGAGRHERAVAPSDGSRPGADSGKLIGPHSQLVEQVRRPPLAVGHWSHCHRGRGVDRGHPAQGVVSSRLRRPQSLHPVTASQPAGEADSLALSGTLAGIRAGDGAGTAARVRGAI